MEKELSIGDTISESKTSMASLPQEIGRNSLQKAYPELHDEPTAELLDQGMLSGSDKDIKELPDWQGQILHELDTGAMQYPELHDMPAAELPSHDMMPGSDKEIKRFSGSSTPSLQKIDPTPDSSALIPSTRPQEAQTDRFTFIRIREKIAMESPMGAPSSLAKRSSDTPPSKPRPALAVAYSKSLPLLPVSKYNTRSKSSSPPGDQG